MKTKAELINWSKQIKERIDSLEIELSEYRAMLKLVDKDIEKMPDV